MVMIILLPYEWWSCLYKYQFTGGNEDNRNTDLDNNYNVTSDDADNRKW